MLKQAPVVAYDSRHVIVTCEDPEKTARQICQALDEIAP